VSGHQFLLELLCEEIPANALPGMRRQLREAFEVALREAGCEGTTSRALSTVRRVAVHVGGLPERQPDRDDERLGPPEKAAFDGNGAPTQAALGFARGQGVDVGELRIVEGPKGRVVAVHKRVPGRPLVEILAELVPAILGRLHFPKTMRWGAGEHAFVRPVHNVVALFGSDALNQVVEVRMFGVGAGSGTFGHRVTSPGPIDLRGAAGFEEYRQRLAAAGVVVDQEERAASLERRAAELAAEVGCTVRPDPELVAEHVELVEYPGALRGAIAARYLELPEEVVATTLRHHQKCLVLEKEGTVAPYFIAVCDRPDDPEGHVVIGNEWVAGARLADAEFFFGQDRKKPLLEHAGGLDRVTFHARLGSYGAKTASSRELAIHIAERAGLAPTKGAVQRAADLAKADLVTAMVGEFPELQGVMGGIYARLDGEADEVWQAISDQYTPAGLEGRLPRGPAGAILGVADRLDTLAHLFAVGEVPTGSKDPFALRRAALAAVRICAEAPLSVDLRDAVSYPFRIARSGSGVAPEDHHDALLSFLRERVRYYLTTVEGVSGDAADAVLGARWGVVPDDVARARAVEAVRLDEVFTDLATAFKRVRNIVAKAEPGAFDDTALAEPAERELLAALQVVDEVVGGSTAGGDYVAALRALSSLAPPLDRFFTDVLVMDEDPGLRAARIGLLRQLEALFLRVADVSLLSAAG